MTGGDHQRDSVRQPKDAMMVVGVLAVAILQVACVGGSRTEGVVLPAPRFAVELNSTRGFEMLGRSLSRSYVQASIHLVTQQSESLCAVASAAVVLNALPIGAPVDPTYSPYPYWTQNSLLNDSCVLSVHNPNYGSTRSQLAAMLSCFAKVRNVSAPATPEALRTLVVSALGDESRDTHVIVNFDRGDLDEAGEGHFSPVAAYDPRDDCLLILDVARYKYPPIWVPLVDLWRAVLRRDPDTSEPRGFLIVQPY